jgi:uncharacterized protein (DUF1501 family)
MTLIRPSRRAFLQLSGALSVVGPSAIPFALQLAAAGSAAGLGTPPDYKALICIFQYGGNDANNSIVATDTDSYGRYFALRNIGQDPIALMPPGTAPTALGQINPVTRRSVSSLAQPEAWGGVLPIVPKTAQAIPAGTNATTRTFGLHPALAPLVPLYTAGRLAVLANVGSLLQPLTKAQYTGRKAPIPANLFSHNDQQNTWQAGGIEGANVGWGGQFGDLILSMNGANSIFTAMSTAGNAVFLAGQKVVQYQTTTNTSPAIAIRSTTSTSLLGSSTAPGLLKGLITDTSPVSDFASDYATVVQRSLDATANLNGAMTTAAVTAVPAVPTYTNPVTGNTTTNNLAVQLRAIARIIAAAPALGLKRQVFFVSMGGHDSHDGQNTAQPDNLSKLANAMAYLDTVLSNMNGVDMRSQVTTFTASDFSRTLTSNGDGTDHAWGGHHFIMGGAVKGGDIYGQFPTIGVDAGSFNNPDVAGAAIIPTTSVDQYAATLGAWFGATPTDLATIIPRLKNYPTANLGFV